MNDDNSFQCTCEQGDKPNPEDETTCIGNKSSHIPSSINLMSQSVGGRKGGMRVSQNDRLMYGYTD